MNARDGNGWGEGWVVIVVMGMDGCVCASMCVCAHMRIYTCLVACRGVVG